MIETIKYDMKTYTKMNLTKTHNTCTKEVNFVLERASFSSSTCSLGQL